MIRRIKEMQKVYLDEELIRFEGPALENSEQLRQVISNHLLTQGRCIEKFEVRENGEINIRSVVFELAYLKLIKVSSLGMDHVLREMKRAGGLLLREPREIGIGMIGKMIGQLSGFIELLITLKDYPEDSEWRCGINDFHRRIENDLLKLSEEIKKEDLIRISELISVEIYGSVKKALELINDSICDYFKKGRE